METSVKYHIKAEGVKMEAHPNKLSMNRKVKITSVFTLILPVKAANQSPGFLSWLTSGIMEQLFGGSTLRTNTIRKLR
jgi:hypothetical protein